MSEIKRMFNRVGLLGVAVQTPSTGEIIGWKPMEFTAEKQLEITKFLLKKAVYYDVKDDKYWFYYEECESAGYKSFDEAIAHFINKLWQDLTPEEKQQVKGILK